MLRQPLDPGSRNRLLEEIKRAHELRSKASATGALAYLHNVVIDCGGEPRLYRDVAEPWQWLLASRMIPALDSVAGLRKDYKGPRSFWFTLPRGHDKTSLIGRFSSWLLSYSRMPIRCVAAAADKEQAGLITEFMTAEAKLNPWLQERLKFANWRVEGPQGSQLKILAAEAPSSFGLKEDLMILDEITHWSKRGLWDTVYSGREKRPDSILIVITNAGLLKTWQHDAYMVAKSSPHWYVYDAPGQIAGWMSREKINEIRRSLPAPLARRLFDNVWIDPGEECGFLTREEVNQCVDFSAGPAHIGDPKHQYIASIDYAPVRDRTVMCVGHEHDGKVILDRMDILQGSRENRVQIEVIERWIDEVSRTFFKPVLVVDLYQMESTAQKYEGTLEVVRFEARGGKANYELASNLRNLAINSRLVLYPNAAPLVVQSQTAKDGVVMEDLVDELSSVLLKTTSYGYRIDHTSGQHDDRTVALGQMALEAVKRSSAVCLPGNLSRWF